MANGDEQGRALSTRRFAGYVIFAVNVILGLWLLGSVHDAQEGSDARAKTTANALLIVWIAFDLVVLVVWLVVSRKPSADRARAERARQANGDRDVDQP